MAFLLYLYRVIWLLCEVLTFAIIARAILSWFSPRPTNRLAIILYQVTEPVLSPLRRVIPRVGMIDLTPLAAIMLLQLIVRLLP